MNRLDELKQVLEDSNVTLAVYEDNGNISKYYGNRVENLKNILRKDKEGLRGKTVGDKVIGKVAASIMIVAGVKEVYAKIISKKAIELFTNSNIHFDYLEKVEYIENATKNGMCPMENRYKEEDNIYKIYYDIIC